MNRPWAGFAHSSVSLLIAVLLAVGMGVSGAHSAVAQACYEDHSGPDQLCQLINAHDASTQPSSAIPRGVDPAGVVSAGRHTISCDVSLVALDFVAPESGADANAVIGKVKDLGSVGDNEYPLLDKLPNQGSPAANWAQNSGVLRKAGLIP